MNIAVRWNEFAPLPLPPAQKVALLQQQYDARHTGYRSEFPHADFRVVERDGVPVGRYYVDRRADAFHLVDIALLPDCAGQGIGGTLIDALIDGAAAVQLAAELRVDHFNPAKRLYQRKGFVEIEDFGLDCLMRWQAPQSRLRKI